MSITNKQLMELIRMEGYMVGMVETIIILLRKKLGYLPKDVITKIHDSDGDELNELITNFFNIYTEEDILKYIH
jgi:hypothetical protein